MPITPAIFRRVRGGPGVRGRVALAGLATFAIAMALASPAQGARYIASVQMREGPMGLGQFQDLATKSRSRR